MIHNGNEKGRIPLVSILIPFLGLSCGSKVDGIGEAVHQNLPQGIGMLDCQEKGGAYEFRSVGEE